MIDKVKSWFNDNHALAYFLAAQVVAVGTIVISIVAYMVRLEARVTTIETRGTPHIAEIDTRLTVIGEQTKDNKESIDRIVAVMTKNLGK